MLDTCLGKELTDHTISSPSPEREVFQVNKYKHTNRVFKMTIVLGGYDMDEFMLDLGSNVNFLPKKS
jgi:hypothetical protein